MPSTTYTPPSARQVRLVRELWLLREQARVHSAERAFLDRLTRLLQTCAPYSPSPPAPPPPPPHTPSSAPAHVPAPPAPPPPPQRSLQRTKSLPTESFGVVRERPTLFAEEVRELRAQRGVTNLSPEFRARLEGVETEVERVSRVGSWVEALDEAGNVRNALESEFRHTLERLLVSRGEGDNTEVRRPPREPTFEQIVDESVDFDEGPPPQGDRYLVSTVRELEREVAVLKNVVNASFDLQLDMQRAIRQEVAAAISGRSGQEVDCAAVRKGVCTICMEAPIDSLLYACGHMCTCSACGRSLLASGIPCPICRAPIRDVVRAFVVSGSAAGKSGALETL